MKFQINLILFILFLTSLLACEKEITVDLPPSEIKLVVEGRIEQHQPPVIILTESMGYFDLTNYNTLSSIFVHNADVTIKTGSETFPLIEICSDSIDEALLPLISEISGISVQNLKNMEFCIYSTQNVSAWGKTGSSYELIINSEGKTYSASTSIPQPIMLDSLWFEAISPADSLGYVWATLSDPPGLGNYYRWYAKRMTKDDNFIAPLGSVFDDKFTNGVTFNFGYNRGTLPGSEANDDFGDQKGKFVDSDTVVVKFCAIDKATFDFIRTCEADIANNGNPFAAPSSVRTNIKGGALGYWGGYGAFYDTLYPKP